MKKRSGAILLVANHSSQAGYAWWLMENFWSRIARMAKKQGRKCFLIYPEIGALPQLIQRSPLEILELDFGNRSVMGIRQLYRFVKENRIRSIYLSDRPYLDWMYWFVRMCGVNSIVVHDHSPGERRNTGGIKRALKVLAHRLEWFSCDTYIAVTEYVKDRMINTGMVSPDRCFVVPNGVMPVNCEDMDRNWLRNSMGCGSKSVIVGMASRATHYKNIDFAIRCARWIKSNVSGLDIRFVLCGDGPDLEEFRELAHEIGVTDEFIFLGNRDDTRHIMYEFDIGFHPSRGEVGYCLSILEMMSAGIPVVVSDRESVCQATTHKQTGWVYKADSIESACKGLVALARDPNMRKEIGGRARRIVDRTYSLVNTNKILERIVGHAL